jgi:hypothetical protein
MNRETTVKKMKETAMNWLTYGQPDGGEFNLNIPFKLLLMKMQMIKVILA